MTTAKPTACYSAMEGAQAVASLPPSYTITRDTTPRCLRTKKRMPGRQAQPASGPD